MFFHEIDKMTRALAPLSVDFESENPLTALMEGVRKGRLREDILKEKVLSAIIELKVTLGELPKVLSTVERVASELDTVVSVGVSSKCDNDGRIPHEEVCVGAGYALSPNGKTNLGLGRPVSPGE